MNELRLPAPLFTAHVQDDWIDYNGHMNDAAYARVFSLSVDRLMAAIGLDQNGREKTSLTIYTLTMTIHYLKEAHLGDALSVTGRILEHDDKRLRLWFEMKRGDDATSALNEQVLLCVDQSGDKPRAAPFAPKQIARIRAFHASDAAMPIPKQAGRGISLRKAE